MKFDLKKNILKEFLDINTKGGVTHIQGVIICSSGGRGESIILVESM